MYVWVSNNWRNLVGWLESHWGGRLGEWYTKFEKLDDDSGEILEEEVVVLGVFVDPLFEGLVGYKSHIGRKHHKGLGLLVLELLSLLAVITLREYFWVTYLLRSLPVLPLPLFAQEQLIVLVGNDGWREGPWSLESTASGVATTQSVSSRKSNNLLVIETHSVEDVSQVLVSLGSIRETSIRCASSDILILSSWSVWNLGTHHLLNGTNTSENPEIGVADPWVGLYFNC